MLKRLWPYLMFLIALLPSFVNAIYDALHPQPTGPLTGAGTILALVLYSPQIGLAGIVTTLLTRKSKRPRLYSLLGFLVPSLLFSFIVLINLLYLRQSVY